MEEAACAELLWQSGFVWDAAAARSLRERHRLVGDAVGCIPGSWLPSAGAWQAPPRASWSCSGRRIRVSHACIGAATMQ